MSVKKQILDNLQAAIEAIQIVNGYTIDIGLVSRRAFGQDEVDRSATPAVSIIEDAERDRGRIGLYRRISSTVLLEGLVRFGSSSPQSPDVSGMYNDFIGDLRKCLHAASLGDNVIYHRLQELTPLVGEAVVFFSHVLEICYYYPEASP